MPNITKKYLLLFLLAILLLTGGVFMYLYFQSSNKPAKFKSSFQEAKGLLKRGSTGDAILKFEEAAKNATNENEAANAKLNLDFALLSADTSRGIAALKAFALDESMPPGYRATAINALLIYLLGSKDVGLAVNQIFTGGKWQTFMAGAPPTLTGVDLAIRRAFEWSVELFPGYTAEYRIGWWYGKQIKSGAVKGKEAEAAGDTIQKRIAAGDILLFQDEKRLSSLSSDVINNRFEPHQIAGNGYSIRGLALEGLWLLGRVSEDTVRQSYEKALAIVDKYINDDRDLGTTLLYTRFNFAAFLAGVNLQKNREEIVKILSPIYGYISQSKAFPAFLRNEAQGDDAVVRKAIINLGLADPRFKNLLLSLGWKEKDFQ